MRLKAVTTTLTSPILAVALAVAPTHAALAAPAEEEAPAEEAAPEGEEPAGEEAGEEPAGEEGGEEPAGEEGGEEAGEEGGEEQPPPTEEEVLPDAPPPEEVQPEAPPPEIEEAPDPMADRPEEPMINGKPRKGIGMMISGGVVLAGGIASTITFAMVTRGCSLDGPLGCKHQNQDQFLIPLGAAITLLGAMLLAVGVGYHVHYRKWQRWTPADAEKKKRRGRRGRKSAMLPSPTLMRGGGGLSLAGKF